MPTLSTSRLIDHLAIDLGGRRLLVAELGNNTIDVIDLDTSQPIHRIGGLRQPEGVAYVPGSDLREGRQVRAWSASNLCANFTLALDAADAMLAVAFAGQRDCSFWILPMDRLRRKRTPVATPMTTFFDGGRGRTYVSCGRADKRCFEDGNDASIERARLCCRCYFAFDRMIRANSL